MSDQRALLMHRQGYRIVDIMTACGVTREKVFSFDRMENDRYAREYKFPLHVAPTDSGFSAVQPFDWNKVLPEPAHIPETVEPKPVRFAKQPDTADVFVGDFADAINKELEG